MPQRTTILAVQTLLGSNYGPLSNELGGAYPNLQQFIDTAWPLVDQVVYWGNKRYGRAGGGLTTFLQEIVERYLACHFYQQMDQGYASKSQGGASASFQGQLSLGIESSPYGRTALNVDWTGILSAINKRAFAGGHWLGRQVGCLPCVGTGTGPTSMPEGPCW